MPCEHTHGSDTIRHYGGGYDFGSCCRADVDGDCRAARFQYRLGRAAAVLARAVRHECHSVLAYRLIATLVVMIALLMAFRRYRAYHRAIAAL